MALKNYTTTITVHKTLSEIEKNLSEHGASRTLKSYTDGVPTAVAFSKIIESNGQMKELNFKLPMREENIMQVFKNQNKKGKLPKRYCNLEQARRTGWRIIKDWIDSQMAILEIEMVKFEEIFLPYLYDVEKDQTMFEKLQQKNYLLEEIKGDKDENKSD